MKIRKLRINLSGTVPEKKKYGLVLNHELRTYDDYTDSLVNADSFYANFTDTNFQKIPIPHIKRTMKQKFLH
jgi:hypothetical protein